SNIIESLKLKLDEEHPIAIKFNEYQKLKTDLVALKISSKDSQMTQFLLECDKKLLNGADKSEQLNNMSTIITQMKAIKEGLNSPENKEVKKIIHKLDRENRWGGSSKARKIEEALGAVPIEERVTLLQSKHPSVTIVFEAIASHRILTSFNNVKTKDGTQIKVEDAANSFKDFKNKFKEQFKSRQDVESTQEDVIESSKQFK
ncbi:MAG: hypothetical protein PSV35_08150, partial [bacterium]|nr:hypothetical protein [bacterium]